MEARLNHQLTGIGAEELRGAAEAPSLPAQRPAFADAVSIREAGLSDSRAIDALAALDSRHRPLGRLLVAEVGGQIAAALPLDGGSPIADPFRPTAELLALLEARAAQLGGRRRRRLPLARPRLRLA
jgi:hypothetical protein